MPTVNHFDERFIYAVESMKCNEYTAEMNLAAGLRSYMRFVRDSEPHTILSECLGFDRERYGRKIQEEMKRLIDSPYDLKYEHPYDCVVSTLALALLDAGWHKENIPQIGTANWAWANRICNV